MLIALLLLVLFGMLGLAIDAGRAYVDRRMLQDAVDAAALAAGDWYENYGDVNGSLNHAALIYQRDLSLPSGSTSISGSTLTATWPGYSLTIAGANGQFNGYVFQATTSHTFPLTFFQVLGSNPTVPVQGAASAIVGNQFSQPALLTLGTAGCSMSFSGSTSVTVRGDVYSDGCIGFQGSSSLGVAGSAFSASGTPPSGISLLCYNPDPTVPPHAAPCVAGETQGQRVGSAPVIPDPGYPGGHASYYSSTAPAPINHGTAWKEMQPGVYSNWALTGGAGCYFMDAGIYQFGGGYTSHGGYTSNELKPPEEPAWNYTSNALDYTAAANPQFWNDVPDRIDCSSTFALATTSSGTNLNPSSGNWAVEVTTVRSDYYPPSGQPGATQYYRESAPSRCHDINVNGAAKGFSVTVSRSVPGVQSYRVYIYPGVCAGAPQSQFGYAGTFNESPGNGTFDGGNVPGGTTWPFGVRDSRCPVSAPAVGCAPPDGESKPQCFIGCSGTGNNGLNNSNPPMAVAPQGDLANENDCLPQGTNPAAPCAAAQVTPGAVQFYMPANGDCVNENAQGATWVFSGYQYDWITIYEPIANTSCGNLLNGGSNESYIGTAYTPGAGWTINGGAQAPLSGQVIASSASLNGNSTIGINFNPNYAPAPPAARLVQ